MSAGVRAEIMLFSIFSIWVTRWDGENAPTFADSTKRVSLSNNTAAGSALSLPFSVCAKIADSDRTRKPASIKNRTMVWRMVIPQDLYKKCSFRIIYFFMQVHYKKSGSESTKTIAHDFSAQFLTFELTDSFF